MAGPGRCDGGAIEAMTGIYTCISRKRDKATNFSIDHAILPDKDIWEYGIACGDRNLCYGL